MEPLIIPSLGAKGGLATDGFGLNGMGLVKGCSVKILKQLRDCL